MSAADAGPASMELAFASAAGGGFVSTELPIASAFDAQVMPVLLETGVTVWT